MSNAESWLTQRLIGIGYKRIHLKSVQNHKKCLGKVLSSEDAIWTLCSIMVPEAPESDLPRDPELPVKALANYRLIHVKAYVTHVNFEAQREVGFKLTEETIEELITYHKDAYVRHESNQTSKRVKKEQDLQRFHDKFCKAVNEYVFRTGVQALEGLVEGGGGNLLNGQSQNAKDSIVSLFFPLSSPPRPNQSLATPRSRSFSHPVLMRDQKTLSGGLCCRSFRVHILIRPDCTTLLNNDY
jgi:hypothetical protein